MSAFEAFRADVSFNIETGRAEADLTKLRREAHAAYGQMSDDALKLAAAQDRYDRVLAKHGPTSRQARDAEIRYRREVESATRSTNEQTVALDRNEREMRQAARGAVAGTGAFHGLGRSVAFASATFLGSAGLVFAIRSTLAAAKNAQVVLGQTENAVKRSGLSWAQYGKQIQQAALDLANIAGFDDERLLQTFSTFVRRTKDVNEALRLNALAADVARGRNIELEQAAQLVLKASIGQAGALRRLGIDAKAGSSALQLLALLQERYAGSAAKYATTAQGAQDRFNVALENTQELVGAALLPSVTHYLDAGAKWLSQTRNQERIQRDVNEVVHTATGIIHGFAKAVDAVDGPIKAVVEGLGGIEKVAEAALILGLLSKAKRAATGFAIIRAESALTRTAIVADSAAEAAAMARAGATGTVTGGGTATGKGGKRVPILFGGNFWTVAATLALVYGPGAAKKFLDNPGISPTVAGVGGFPKGSPQETAYIASLRAQFAGYDAVEAARSSGGYAGAPGPPLPLAAGATNLPAEPLNAAQQRARDLATYAGTGGAQEVAAQRAQAEYDRRALAFLERRRAAGKIRNAKYIEEYQAIYGDLTSREQRIAEIADANAKKAADARKKREEARAKMIAALIPDTVRGTSTVAGVVPLTAAQRSALAGEYKVLRGGVTAAERQAASPLAGLVPGQLPERFALEERLTEARSTSEKAVLPILRREVDALQGQLQLLKANHGKRLDILKVQVAIAETNRRIRDIRKKDTAAAPATTVADLRAAALSDLQTYGGNLGGFSPQGALGGLSALILRELKEANQHAQRTAHATSSIDRSRPTPIQAARALAGIS